MTANATIPATTHSAATPSAGTLCLVGGLIGVGQALVLLLVPAAVGTDQYSYPFTPAGYAVAQFTFFLQHLLLLPALVWLARSSTVRGSRPARLAARAAVLGMALLALLELVAIAVWREVTTSSLATTVTNAYGLPVLLLGVALTLLGALLLRTRSGASGARPVAWTVLALGLYVFVPLTPAIMGPFVAGRLAIGGWMALFAVLGLLLRRQTAATR